MTDERIKKKGKPVAPNLLSGSGIICPVKRNPRLKIPPIIHQTSKSRCLTQLFGKVTTGWGSLQGYDDYFHDDEAVMRLLLSDQTAYDFPLVHQLVAANCLQHGTLKADIWRYLVLWSYGGIYADIDTQPTALFLIRRIRFDRRR